jgi:ribosome assembly protein 1
MPQLVEGLRLLNQSDPCVQVMIQETGEHVIVTAGELHLERCLKDLRDRFAGIEIQASESIVPFRETISCVKSNRGTALTSFVSGNFSGVLERVVGDQAFDGVVTVSTANRLCDITVRAVPLPTGVSNFLFEREQDIRGFVERGGGQEFLDELKDVVRESGDEAWKTAAGKEGVEALEGVGERLWEFGPKRVGSNVLMNAIPGYKRGYAYCSIDLF